MAEPTPAQIAKARAIAEQVRERAIDFSLGTDLGQHLLSDHDAVSAIAAALADEAQHTVKLETHQLAMKLGERAFRERDEARQQLADAEQRGRQAWLREAAEALERVLVPSALARATDTLRQLAEEGPSR